MLDRLRFTWDATEADATVRELLERLNGRKILTCPYGDILDDKPYFRPSDHGLVRFRYTVDENGRGALAVDGSPAALCGDGEAVFGAGPSRTMDLRACGTAMLRGLVLEDHETGLSAPLVQHVNLDDCTIAAADVTINAEASSAEAARKILDRLALVPYYGRRPRVERHGLYWSRGGRLLSPKAYLKGQRLRQKQKKRTGRFRYSEEQLRYADRLVRLELQIRDRWWSQQNAPWDVAPALLLNLHSEVYTPMLKQACTPQALDEVRSRLQAQYERERAANLSQFYALVFYAGYETARTLVDKRSFRRKAALLREAGITGLEQLGHEQLANDEQPEEENRNQLRLVTDWPEGIRPYLKTEAS